VHDLEGRDTGRRLGVGEFRAQAEGIAAWTCPDGSGYWVAADQFTDRTVFRVFDRATLATLGAFVGRRTAGTDGLWIRQAPSPRFPAGVLYAADDDLRVSAFDWRDVARALGLRETCR
ncbi:MAG: phytase, partial [Lysobacteraceae bacterium]